MIITSETSVIILFLWLFGNIKKYWQYGCKVLLKILIKKIIMILLLLGSDSNYENKK